MREPVPVLQLESAEATQPVVATSGKSFATSGKSRPLPESRDLPPIAEADPDVVLQEDIKRPVRGWRLEQNSNGYWRWRYQEKADDGRVVMYHNRTGKIAYKRGSQYVKLGELDAAREEASRLAKDEPV